MTERELVEWGGGVGSELAGSRIVRQAGRNVELVQWRRLLVVVALSGWL